MEATKSVFDRIREISGIREDGGKLIDSTLGGEMPILIINKFVTESEKSEHKGFSNLLKGLYGMFRLEPTLDIISETSTLKSCKAVGIPFIENRHIDVSKDKNQFDFSFLSPLAEHSAINQAKNTNLDQLTINFCLLINMKMK